ncbi:DUF58 domain-containing protein [Bailinhaonella thermotolerans]|uniref:DUF58 domain-containing protein n=1 Tax=Bailinhaonella thermotolerans TaxID=1070861 RepID=A0A3A4BC04_9ACTN|nr:DUF58 domain-containing protein [Bailinhaonella thermotolerans]RJL36053.1 DUF58 domain-containing protein [Bailinhaonella thermotolerans]
MSGNETTARPVGPATERALRRLELTVTRRLDGLLQGDHLGLLPGPGSEPAEGRAYVPGDDVRAMDWNLTARANAPHVRDRVADRELETWLLVDATASMDFGTGLMEKRDLALAAVAAVGFLAQRSGNRVGAQIMHASGARRIPARPGRAHLLALLRALVETPRSEPAPRPPGLGPGAVLLSRTASRRGLAVVVSDFLEPVESWARPLRLLARRHQVLAAEVLDPRELTLPDVGLLAVVDPETGRRREVPTASRRLRERYAAAALAQREAIARAVRDAGAAHLRLRTDGDWMREVVRHVRAQRRLAAARPAPRPGGGAA